MNFWYTFFSHDGFLLEINNSVNFQPFDPFLVSKFSNWTPLTHSSPLRYLTQEKWIPTFWMPILDILDFQQPGMIKIMRTVQAIF